MSFGVVLYAKDVTRVSAFYAGLGDWPAIVGDGYTTVAPPGFEIVVVEVPNDVAATITVTEPPGRRTATPVKLVIPVVSIAAARDAAPRSGAVVDPTDREWHFGPTLRCDGHDPEGNVFQLSQLTCGGERIG